MLPSRRRATISTLLLITVRWLLKSCATPTRQPAQRLHLLRLAQAPAPTAARSLFAWARAGTTGLRPDQAPHRQDRAGNPAVKASHARPVSCDATAECGSNSRGPGPAIAAPSA